MLKADNIRNTKSEERAWNVERLKGLMLEKDYSCMGTDGYVRKSIGIDL